MAGPGLHRAPLPGLCDPVPPVGLGVSIRDERVLLGLSAFTGLRDTPGGPTESLETLEEGPLRGFYDGIAVEPERVRLLDVGENFVYFTRCAGTPTGPHTSWVKPGHAGGGPLLGRRRTPAAHATR